MLGIEPSSPTTKKADNFGSGSINDTLISKGGGKESATLADR